MTPLVFRSPLSLILVTVAAMSVLPLRAAAPRDSISPFMVRTSGAPDCEFYGVVEDAHGVKFRLYDPERKVGSWVMLRENDEVFGVTAIEFKVAPADKRGQNGQSAHDSLVVDYKGRRFTLWARAAKVTSVSNNRLEDICGSIRLKSVAEEVERRRAERERAGAAQSAKAK